VPAALPHLPRLSPWSLPSLSNDQKNTIRNILPIETIRKCTFL
jgi:hypothetical protein